MNEINTAAHYHVFAVQDWGGSQESWRGWDDKWSSAEAREHLLDLLICDMANHPEHQAALIERYGEDRYCELTSDNVAPGWEAIWIAGCTKECDFKGQFDRAETRRLGEPTWTMGSLWNESVDWVRPNRQPF